jgi:hypothetical protein
MMTMRRYVTACLLLTLLVLGGGGWAAAAEDSPAGLDARLAGFPRMTIRITPERIEAPERVTAGPTLVIEERRTLRPRRPMSFLPGCRMM